MVISIHDETKIEKSMRCFYSNIRGIARRSLHVNGFQGTSNGSTESDSADSVTVQGGKVV